MLFTGRSLKKVDVCDGTLLYHDLHDQVDHHHHHHCIIIIIIITITNILIIHSCFIVMLIISVGFGNVASETDNEKIFSILMMIVAGTNDYDDDCGIFPHFSKELHTCCTKLVDITLYF